MGSSVRVQSLLNPENIHEYLLDYTYGNYEDIKKRFALNSNMQVDAMYDYLIDATVVFLQQDCTYESVAYGSLLQKAMNNSWTQLRDTLPIEMIARTLSYQIKETIYNCENMVNIAYDDYTRSELECLKHDMTNSTTIKFYINATWYGDSKYKEDFLSETGMTTPQFEAFFNTKN